MLLIVNAVCCPQQILKADEALSSYVQAFNEKLQNAYQEINRRGVSAASVDDNDGEVFETGAGDDAGSGGGDAGSGSDGDGDGGDEGDPNGGGAAGKCGSNEAPPAKGSRTRAKCSICNVGSDSMYATKTLRRITST